MIVVKSMHEFLLMQKAGRIVATVLNELEAAIKPGVTTKELDEIAETTILKLGGVPAFKGYGGFPASICTSVNEEVVHGIPGKRVLKEGDIISIDVGAFYEGYCGDAARTFPVGRISPLAEQLLQVTKEALEKGVAMAKVGNRLTDISHAIQTHVEAAGFSVVRQYVGHGIGQKMHEEPQVPNYGLPGRGPRLKAGMALAIEPMVNTGEFPVRTLSDNWTVVTQDGSLSAHFEDTVFITEDGNEVLTAQEEV
ncbi:MAG: type I methionyl aminopeptidase [Bacillota bacterium]|jgi:methionyl aminopeptidase|nr:type I methionyl aminopeptidase [Bacillota bacterium]NLU54678.1 type I methionyl aminopeptidase [Bacillota bacterium]HOA90481.1 type I methionyl aminopeptidase [Bacillota bacterium]HOL13437.1 type I methionyl aminopeptidase [Bacillota bacterium]HPT61374.1 type I methionyl aminopeptidase [Bacillota bacterium]